ncbi:MAG: hypothetical protein R3200_16595, partial [Xanthomonadales bacterium]|nr:hypothetical protein [Xanthomonadales bacterium]
EGGGAVYSYRLEGGEQVLEGRIPIPDGFVTERFGTSVAIDGDTLVIGAPGDPVVPKGSGLQPLRAAIFQRVNQEWQFKQSLTSSETDGDEFGTAVAIDQGMLVVGAPAEGESGKAHVFDLEGGNWVFMGRAQPPDPQPGERFGAAVSTGGGKIAVGSPNSQVGQAVSGSVSLFDIIEGNLSEIGSVAGSDAGTGSEFGASVVLENDVMLVGSPGENNDQGAIYRFDPSSQITQTGRMTADDSSPGDRLGAAVSIDAETNTVAAGAPGVANVGAFYTFIADSLAQKARYDVEDDEDAFGASIAISGEQIIVGAPATRDEGTVVLLRGTQLIFRNGFE